MKKIYPTVSAILLSMLVFPTLSHAQTNLRSFNAGSMENVAPKEEQFQPWNYHKAYNIGDIVIADSDISGESETKLYQAIQTVQNIRPGDATKYWEEQPEKINPYWVDIGSVYKTGLSEWNANATYYIGQVIYVFDANNMPYRFKALRQNINEKPDIATGSSKTWQQLYSVKAPNLISVDLRTPSPTVHKQEILVNGRANTDRFMRVNLVIDDDNKTVRASSPAEKITNHNIYNGSLRMNRVWGDKYYLYAVGSDNMQLYYTDKQTITPQDFGDHYESQSENWIKGKTYQVGQIVKNQNGYYFECHPNNGSNECHLYDLDGENVPYSPWDSMTPEEQVNFQKNPYSNEWFTMY